MSNLKATVLILTTLMVTACGKSPDGTIYYRSTSDVLNTTIALNEGPGSTGPLKEGPGSTGPLKEGPSTTGALKEGPGSTGPLKEGPSTTGALKLLEKNITLTKKVDGIENTVTPENIKSIEISGLNYKKTIKASEINLLQTGFSVKAVDTEHSIASFDGRGNFNFKFDNEVKNLIFKFNLDESYEAVVIPAFNDTTNIRAVLSKDEKGINTILCGALQADGTVDLNKELLSVTRQDNHDYSIFVLSNEVSRREYYLASIENNKDGILKPDHDIKIDNYKVDKYAISDQIGKISALTPYIGKWSYKFFNQDIDIDITDKGNGKFTSNISINEKKFSADGIYLLNSDNNYLIVEGNKGNASVRVAFSLKNTNSLDVVLDDVKYKDISLFKSTKFTFSRKITP